jgi:hypothetical protein
MLEMLETLMDAPWWESAFIIAFLSTMPLLIAWIIWESSNGNVFGKLVKIVLGIGIYVLSTYIFSHWLDIQTFTYTAFGAYFWHAHWETNFRRKHSPRGLLELEAAHKELEDWIERREEHLVKEIAILEKKVASLKIEKARAISQ